MTAAPIDFGYLELSARNSLFSGRIALRLMVVTVTLFALALAMAVTSIFLGDYPLTPREVVGAFAGTADAFTSKVVLEWRVPIVVAAVVFGAVLGIGGAVFQSLTRNPLGSPDVIGFDAGSYTAVVVTMLVVGTQHYWVVAGASVGGGLLTAAAVYLMAYRRGMQGFRLIIVGIGVAAVLGSVNTYLITRADLDDALQVGFWGAGSLTRVSWQSLVPSLVIALLLVVACAVLAPALRTLELGDDAAATQGVSIGWARVGLLITGVATTALVTAAAGPIGFVALIAPQIARRVARTPGVSVLAAAAMGALLLSAAYLLSQTISYFYRPIPVGLLTICLGGIYLIGLLIRESRAQSGAAR
ncbi:MAG: iron chelate uptake ABC transporter family permease subunit [Microbacterium sp.]|jgi:iron complex transport system permease protein|nr:iron chelate uptake ABC transporter family permease subunit [Microbacterium sp.]